MQRESRNYTHTHTHRYIYIKKLYGLLLINHLETVDSHNKKIIYCHLSMNEETKERFSTDLKLLEVIEEM